MSAPSFDAFFTGDGYDDVVVVFVPDQALYAVFGGETGLNVVLVFIDPLQQV